MADTLHSFTSTPPHNALLSPDRNKDIRKSLTFSGGHHIGRTGENVGVVKARPRLEVCFFLEPFFQHICIRRVRVETCNILILSVLLFP